MDKLLNFTDKELELTEKYFKNADPNTSICLEYGSGASTTKFSKYVNTYYSIEHDYNWYIKVQTELLKRNITNVQLFLIKSKCESNTLKNHDTKTYNNEIGKYIFEEYINFNKNLPQLDFVFIDGRARKHCTLNVFNNLKPESIIIFHDFNNREYYNDILQKYTIIETEKTLAILKLK